MYDVILIGAGVVGAAAARFLSAYKGSFCVIDKAADVGCGTSKANSAVIHAGFDAKAGTQMAKYNVLGSRMMESLAAELDIPYRRNGSLVVCLKEEDLPRLQALYENGLKNGVEGLEIVDAERLRAMEPHVSDQAVAALWAPTGAIVCPFGMTIAFAENACTNGVEFKLNTTVTRVRKSENGWTVQTDKGTFETRCVVNAAGVYSDVLHNMVSSNPIHITPRRGDYVLMDKAVGDMVHSTVFQLPGVMGKGVLVTPTIHGNLLAGPTARDMEDREASNTTADSMGEVLEKARNTVPELPARQVITSFGGLRAHEDGHEFIIGEAADAPGFFDCAGIESPGLSSAPAIGKDMAEMLAKKLNLEKNPNFVGTRKGILNPRELTKEQRAALIKEQSAYGQIICRCEGISEGEILDAIHRPLGATTLDGIKRRTRAGMGRCQSGFCSPRVMEILGRELWLSKKEITKSGGGSHMLAGPTKR